MLDCTSVDWRSEALADGCITLDRDVLPKGVAKWAEVINPHNYDRVRQYIGYVGYADKGKMVSEDKDKSQFAKYFLDKALCAKVEALKKTGNQRGTGYGVKVVKFGQLQQVLQKYKPGALTRHSDGSKPIFAEYAFQDDE